MKRLKTKAKSANVQNTGSVRQAYKAWSEIYDSNDNATRDLDAVLLRAADLVLEHAHVVELGAGTGKNTRYLASRAHHVTAMDLTPAMLDRARLRVPDSHVSFVEHDLTQSWPVDNNCVDLVVGNLVLEHIADLGFVMQEAARVLRAGGTLYLSELHPFRQLQSKQARFTIDGETTFVDAFLHTTSDYIRPALANGFVLREMTEALEDNLPVNVENPPRILTLRFELNAS
ncbi:MAG: class I SAM-dependent methyltransferase [Maricaulis sp.]|jgi:ubiquinone/menaquinone biosynthesis C-methylase UbiE|nr:class I SAM-dependent methyltransferase [Maricaulis sp.]MDG2043932.1 class I SAM-dependent methyltransferase [Maricaulis sp.]